MLIAGAAVIMGLMIVLTMAACPRVVCFFLDHHWLSKPRGRSWWVECMRCDSVSSGIDVTPNYTLTMRYPSRWLAKRRR